MERQLILLSNSFKNLLKSLIELHDCEISKTLIEADDLIYEMNCLINIINSNKNKIYNILQNKLNLLINDNFRMITYKQNCFEISFLPKGKMPIYKADGIWSRENRQSGKPARIIQKLLVKKFNNLDFELFNNRLKALMLSDGDFKVVEKEDITKYYNEENYYSTGYTLGNSCMRDDSCKDFFKLYEDLAKMLVFMKDDKIKGRAIIWEICGKTYMDRVYTDEDYIEGSFYEHAKENKWIIRSNNSLIHDGEVVSWLLPDDNYSNEKELDLKIKLNEKYDKYPYMDTFRYLNYKKDEICTLPNYAEYTMSSTIGDICLYETEEYTCGCCDHTICIAGDSELTSEGWCYSEYEGCWYCSNCAFYCDGIDDTVSIDTETCEVIDEDGMCHNYPLDFLIKHDDFIYINGCWYHIEYIKDSPDFVYINNEWYHIDDAEQQNLIEKGEKTN